MEQQTQQTAVEWLISQIVEDQIIKAKSVGEWEIVFQKAQEMEKEQREKDFIEGYKKRAELSNLPFDKTSELLAKSLFNETFKNK